MDKQKTMKIFFYLCIVFGVLNILFGIAVFFSYLTLHSQLSSTLQSINQSSLDLQLIISNSSTAMSTASNSTVAVANSISTNINAVQHSFVSLRSSFYLEAGYFSNFSINGVAPPQSSEIAGTLRQMGNQFNATQKNLSSLSETVTAEAANVSVPLKNTTASLSKLKAATQILFLVAEQEATFVNGILTFSMLGLTAYMIIEGVIFILLAFMISWIDVPDDAGAKKNNVVADAGKKREMKEDGEEPKEDKDPLSRIKGWFYR